MNNNFENDLKSLYEHSMGIYKAAKSIYDSIMSKKAAKNPEDDPENEKPEENLITDEEATESNLYIAEGNFYRVAPFEEAQKDARNPNRLKDFIYGINKSTWDKLSEQTVFVQSVGKESALIQARIDDRNVTFYMPICNLRRFNGSPSISQMADIILTKDLSLRQAGIMFHIPHTTLYHRLKEELPLVDMGKYYKIRQHLDKNRRNNG